VEWWARLGSLATEVALLIAVARLLNRRAAIALGILLAFFQCAVALSLSGIEMYAMVALFAWALLGRPVALALLVISRPEGILLALIAALQADLKLTWWPLAIGMLGWIGFGLLCGQWMPAGVIAKASTYGVHLFAGWYWFGRLFWPFSAAEEQRSLAVLGIAAVSLAWRAKLSIRGWVFVCAGLGLLLAYWAFGATYFFWYLTLPICAVALVLASAVARWRYGWAFMLLVCVASWTNSYPIARWELQHDGFSNLAAVIPDSGTVLMDAVGVVGWLKPNARFVDMVGLVAPQTMAARQLGNGWLGRLIAQERPDVLVMPEAEVLSNQAAIGGPRPFDPSVRVPLYQETGRTTRNELILTPAGH
jgi:hypothetical protein